MKRFILTGAPGVGKTSVLSALDDQGYAVVAEAATDVIAAGRSGGSGEPWLDPLALARYLAHPVPAALSEEIDRILAAGVYER